MARQGMLSGLGLGMGLMYLFDPDMGRRRRSMLRDKVVGTANDLNRAIDVMLRDNVPSLQGGSERAGESSSLPASTWPPATRLAASIIGSGLVLRALRRPNLLNLPLVAIGIGLFTRALGNLEGTRPAEGSGRSGAGVQEIASPEAGQGPHQEANPSQGS